MSEVRLIDANALKEAIRKRLCISSLKYLTEQEKVIVDEIDNAPTVEKRPQGEWQPISEGNRLIGEGNRHECNRCKEYAPSFKDGSEHLSKFCPNCGADMRGDAE